MSYPDNVKIIGDEGAGGLSVELRFSVPEPLPQERLHPIARYTDLARYCLDIGLTEITDSQYHVIRACHAYARGVVEEDFYRNKTAVKQVFTSMIAATITENAAIRADIVEWDEANFKHHSENPRVARSQYYDLIVFWGKAMAADMAAIGFPFRYRG